MQLAVLVGGAPFSRVYPPIAPLLTPGDLLAFVRAFLKDAGVEVKPVNGVRLVNLISHFNAAELGTFADPIRDLQIARIGKAHHALTDVLDAEDGRWQLQILDLFGYFKTSLAAVGNFIGLPKLSIDIARIEQIMQEDLGAYVAYEARDGEIACVAFTRFRDEVLDKWGIDVLMHPSLASIAAEIFRRRFFVTPPVPFKTVHEPTRRKRRSGEWVDGRRAVHLFDGSRDARIDAIRSLHGGRAEAFVVGLYNAPVIEADVASMYPAASLLQPLPVERTKVVRVTDLGSISKMEGFGLFRFRFPPETPFPNLPVRAPNGTQLLFTLGGETQATFAEVRESLAMGADLELVSAHGFEPTERERDHDVGRFVRALWDEKKAATKGTLRYAIAKELLNSALGKFGQRTRGSNLIALERRARREGYAGVGGFLSAHPDLREVLHEAPSIGSLWSPEWLSLITGRARALMSEIVRRSNALLISTDAVIADATAPLDCPAVDALRSVGSDLLVERRADAALIVRSRMYGLLRRAERVGPDERVLARDERWAVVKAARQGTGESESDFAETLLACLRAGADVAPVRPIRKLLSAEEAVRRHAKVNDSVTVERATKLRWDRKRVLVDRDVNIFTSLSATRPYQSERRREGAAHANLVRSGKARRRARPITEAMRERVLVLLREGQGVRQVARAVGIAASTVATIRDRAGGQT